MNKILILYGRENSDWRLWLVIPQEKLEELPGALLELTPKVLQKIQVLAGMNPPTPEEDLARNQTLFGTPDNPIEVKEIERNTEAEPMNEGELEEALREMSEEGMAILNPSWYPRNKAVWDETPVDSSN